MASDPTYLKRTIPDEIKQQQQIIRDAKKRIAHLRALEKRCDELIQHELEIIQTKQIDDLNLSIRVRNMLKRARIVSINDLLMKTREATPLFMIRNFGDKAHQEVCKALIEYGLIPYSIQD